MSIVPRAVALAVLLAALVTGCSAGSAAAPVSAPPPTVASPAAFPAAPPSSSATPTSTTTAVPAVGECRLADLTAGATRPDGTMNQEQVRVVWTNTSGAPCTMTGFGGADLVAAPPGDRYSLPRSDRPTAAVRLGPGEQAHSTITFLPASSGPVDGTSTGGTYVPTGLLVTPPDETHSTLLDWPGGAVLDQRAATRPGTYLGPVEAGAS